MENMTMIMNNQIFHQAKQRIKEIHEQSKIITPGYKLIFHETTISFELSQFWHEWIPYLSGITFGSYPLTRKQIKEIIEDYEYLNFI